MFMNKRKQIQAKTKINWKFIVQNGLVFCLFVYLIFFGGRGDKIAKNIIISQGNIILFASLFIVFFLYCLVSEKKVTEPVFTTYYLFFLGAAGVSVILSKDFWQSINEYYLWGLYFILFSGLLNLHIYGLNRIEVLDNLLFVGGIYNLIKIFQALSWGGRWIINSEQGYKALLNYRTSSPNLAAAIANLILMVSLAYLISTKYKTKRIFYSTLLVSSILVVSITSSRAGIAAMFAGSIIVITLSVIKNKFQIKDYWEKHKLIVSALGLGFLFIGWRFLASLFDSSRTGLEGRFEYWSVAVQAFLENPIFGSGLYTFGYQLNPILSVPPDYIHSHSHNIFLNILAELGLVGFGLFITFLIKIIANLVKRYRQDNDYIALGTLGGLGSIITHGCFDTLYVEPYLSMIVISILGLSLAPVDKLDYTQKPIMRSKSAWFSLAILAIGCLLYYQRIPLERALKASASNPEKAVEYFDEFIRRKPGNALAYQQRAITASILAAENQNQPDLLLRGIEGFENAIEKDPTWSVNYANLGMLYASKGDYERALELLDQAMRIAPRSQLIIFNKAVIAEAAGLIDLAETCYWDYLYLDESWDFSPFWEQTNLRKRIYLEAQAIQAMNLSQEKSIKEYALISPGTIFSKPHNYLAKYYLERGNFEQARKEVNLAELGIQSSRIQALDLLWIKANLEIKAGNTEKGLYFGQSAINGWLYQSAQGPGTYGQSKYGERLYRSPTLDSELVPQFVLKPIPALWIERMVEVGRWYLDENNREGARSILKEVVKQDSDHQEAIMLLTELDAME